MSIRVRPYNLDDAAAWDDFCLAAHQATFLHSRCFLSYHGERFEDRSLIIEEEEKWFGLFPAALNPEDSLCVVSHPGITYGGILHQGKLRGEKMISALDAIRVHYAEKGYKKLIYKAVPSIYHRPPSQDDLYALFRAGARLIRCDLSSAIDIKHRLPISERRRRGLKKAVKTGLIIREGAEYLPDLWAVLADNLQRKYGVQPVHSLQEITLLAKRFPASIRCVCAVLNDNVIAGVLIFSTSMVNHAQYIASSDEGYGISALDAVFEHCIVSTASEGKRWFDFGISNEKAGMVLNDSLYRFKSEFGGGGVVHEFLELDLT